MKRVKKILKKIRQLLYLVYTCVIFDDSLTLRFIQAEALEYLEICKELGVGDIEAVEDLLFHIDFYFSIPEITKVMVDDSAIPESEYLEEVELQRALERDFICEHLKTLPLGFKV